MTNTLMLFGTIGTGELLVIGVVLLLIFGSRLPEVMRSMGRGITEFKKGLHEADNELRDMREQVDAPADTGAAGKPAENGQ